NPPIGGLQRRRLEPCWVLRLQRSQAVMPAGSLGRRVSLRNSWGLSITHGGNEMRKINVLTFLTLDGVMQGPGGPEEDTSGGFGHGGWSVGYFDEFVGEEMTKEMGDQFDLLLGRRTYDIFASFWPHSDDAFAAPINNATKYVATHRPIST